MYVITFYSFKGGVGRTMALVNVAAELVRRGRKVLVVDFDLEAPGLETYKRLKSPKPHLGIVEYVTEFQRTKQVPNLLDYIYETKPIGKKGGRLWVMPAGRRDAAYHRALANLDWQRLYKDGDGFLLFEDTKKGWEVEEKLKVDYVLIDSRTGETDVLGICTRQLPDSVVVMFTPNEQNLAGLENVCRVIRREETEGLKKKIRLHFVAANVPDLDDENRILHRQLQAFQKRLDFKDLSGMIRRYENLNLLDQSVAVLDHPRSKLARSYRRLLPTLLIDNLTDRDGAMLLLHEYAQRYLPRVAQDVSSEVQRRLGIMEEERLPSPRRIVFPGEPRKEFRVHNTQLKVAINDLQRDLNLVLRIRREDALNKIISNYLDDADILSQVAQCRILEEEFHQAGALLDRVLVLNPNLPVQFDRAMCNKRLGNTAGAVGDMLDFLRTPGLLRHKTLRALRELQNIEPGRLAEALDLPAVQSLDDLAMLDVFDLTWNTVEANDRCINLLRDRVVHDGNSEIRDKIFELTDRLIEDRRWQQAILLLEARRLEDLYPAEAFYLAMAYWGESGNLPEHLCRFALERLESTRNTADTDEEPFDPAAGECWLLWRTGKVSDALRLLDRAIESVEKNPDHAFSYWRWRDVSVDDYLDDCRQLRRMFQGEPLRPAFLGPPFSPFPVDRKSEAV